MRFKQLYFTDIDSIVDRGNRMLRQSIPIDRPERSRRLIVCKKHAGSIYAFGKQLVYLEGIGIELVNSRRIHQKRIRPQLPLDAFP